MLLFLNNDVRSEFHLLPLDRQREIIETASRLESEGKTITVLFVDRIDAETSEISIRVDEQSNEPA